MRSLISNAKKVYEERDRLLGIDKLGAFSERILREVAEDVFSEREPDLDVRYAKMGELLGGTKFPYSFDQVTLMSQEEAEEASFSGIGNNERNSQ